MLAHASLDVLVQVVGYICHELRNPLHIVKTSFQAVSAFASSRAAQLRPVLQGRGPWIQPGNASRSSGQLLLPISINRRLVTCDRICVRPAIARRASVCSLSASAIEYIFRSRFRMSLLVLCLQA